MFGLWGEWDDLRTAEDPQRRGSQFEALVGGVFEAAHFEVGLAPPLG